MTLTAHFFLPTPNARANGLGQCLQLRAVPAVPSLPNIARGVGDDEYESPAFTWCVVCRIPFAHCKCFTIYNTHGSAYDINDLSRPAAIADSEVFRVPAFAAAPAKGERAILGARADHGVGLAAWPGEIRRAAQAARSQGLLCPCRTGNEAGYLNPQRLNPGRGSRPIRLAHEATPWAGDLVKGGREVSL